MPSKVLDNLNPFEDLFTRNQTMIILGYMVSYATLIYKHIPKKKRNLVPFHVCFLAMLRIINFLVLWNFFLENVCFTSCYFQWNLGSSPSDISQSSSSPYGTIFYGAPLFSPPVLMSQPLTTSYSVSSVPIPHLILVILDKNLPSATTPFTFGSIIPTSFHQSSKSVISTPKILST